MLIAVEFIRDWIPSSSTVSFSRDSRGGWGIWADIEGSLEHRQSLWNCVGFVPAWDSDGGHAQTILLATRWRDGDRCGPSVNRKAQKEEFLSAWTNGRSQGDYHCCHATKKRSSADGNRWEGHSDGSERRQCHSRSSHRSSHHTGCPSTCVTDTQRRTGTGGPTENA